MEGWQSACSHKITSDFLEGPKRRFVGLSPNRDSIRWSKKLQPLSRARCSELAMWDLIASGVAFEHPVIE
jgi:hypothetical protein